jgi:hypothetical protein
LGSIKDVKDLGSIKDVKGLGSIKDVKGLLRVSRVYKASHMLPAQLEVAWHLVCEWTALEFVGPAGMLSFHTAAGILTQPEYSLKSTLI